MAEIFQQICSILKVRIQNNKNNFHFVQFPTGIKMHRCCFKFGLWGIKNEDLCTEFHAF